MDLLHAKNATANLDANTYYMESPVTRDKEKGCVNKLRNVVRPLERQAVKGLDRKPDDCSAVSTTVRGIFDKNIASKTLGPWLAHL